MSRFSMRRFGARPVPSFASVALAVAVATGCSSGPPVATPSAPAATPAPTLPVVTPTPEPTLTLEPTPDLAAIGAAYLASADRFNPVLAASLSALADPNNTEEDRVGLYLEIVAAFDRVIADFDAIEFPSAIEADVAGMRGAFVMIRDDFELAADLPSHDPLPVYEEQVAIYKQFADKVRAYLGLPPRPTDPPA